jgi:hypothetical protein
MEGLTRLVADSLARHGFDRPVDYRRLHWSRWFRCESPRSLLFVPSKPGVFALAEEIVPGSGTPNSGSGLQGKRMLAVLQFCEDDDMAFVLDRMLSRQNPMSSRLISGGVFVRYVVIEDQAQRRSICGALNQWLVSSSDKASGIGAHFATSLELTEPRVGADELPVPQGSSVPARSASNLSAAMPPPTATTPEPTTHSSRPSQTAAPNFHSGAATNIHCPSPLPSGF